MFSMPVPGGWGVDGEAEGGSQEDQKLMEGVQRIGFVHWGAQASHKPWGVGGGHGQML